MVHGATDYNMFMNACSRNTYIVPWCNGNTPGFGPGVLGSSPRGITKLLNMEVKFIVGDKAYKPKGYKFPCTIVAIFETVEGNVRVVGEMDEYGLLHIFNETQLEHKYNT